MLTNPLTLPSLGLSCDAMKLTHRLILLACAVVPIFGSPAANVKPVANAQEEKSPCDHTLATPLFRPGHYRTWRSADGTELRLQLSRNPQGELTGNVVLLDVAVPAKPNLNPALMRTMRFRINPALSSEKPGVLTLMGNEGRTGTSRTLFRLQLTTLPTTDDAEPWLEIESLRMDYRYLPKPGKRKLFNLFNFWHHRLSDYMLKSTDAPSP
jgi:hypothetical protein